MLGVLRGLLWGFGVVWCVCSSFVYATSTHTHKHAHTHTHTRANEHTPIHTQVQALLSTAEQAIATLTEQCETLKVEGEKVSGMRTKLRVTKRDLEAKVCIRGREKDRERS